MLAVAQHYAAYISHTQAVHQKTSRRNIVSHAESFARYFDAVAYVGYNDIVGGSAHLYSQLGMLLKMSSFAVYGNKIFRLDERMDEF